MYKRAVHSLTFLPDIVQQRSTSAPPTIYTFNPAPLLPSLLLIKQNKLSKMVNLTSTLTLLFLGTLTGLSTAQGYPETLQTNGLQVVFERGDSTPQWSKSFDEWLPKIQAYGYVSVSFPFLFFCCYFAVSFSFYRFLVIVFHPIMSSCHSPPFLSFPFAIPVYHPTAHYSVLSRHCLHFAR